MPVRDLHPIVQRNKNVAVARQAGIDAVSIELRPHVSGDRQNDMFFQRTGVANGAGVDAAMAGIQHDQESFPRTLRARLFLGRGKPWALASGETALLSARAASPASIILRRDKRVFKRSFLAIRLTRIKGRLLRYNITTYAGIIVVC